MATFKKLLAILVALIVTAAGTYIWVARECKAEATRLEARAEQAAQESQELKGKLEQARRELEDLKVWRHLGELQQRVGDIRTQVDALNYGLALDAVAAIAAGIEKGEFGERFRDSSEELLPFLDRCAEALKKRGVGAREALAQLERHAFELLSGLQGEGVEQAPPDESASVEPPAADEGEASAEEAEPEAAPVGEGASPTTP